MGFLSAPSRQKLTGAEFQLRARADSLAGDRQKLLGHEDRLVSDIMDNRDDKERFLGRGGADVAQALAGPQGYQAGRSSLGGATAGALKRAGALTKIGIATGDIDMNSLQQRGMLASHGGALNRIAMAGQKSAAAMAQGGKEAKMDAKQTVDSAWANLAGTAIGGLSTMGATVNPETGLSGFTTAKQKFASYFGDG